MVSHLGVRIPFHEQTEWSVDIGKVLAQDAWYQQERRRGAIEDL